VRRTVSISCVDRRMTKDEERKRHRMLRYATNHSSKCAKGLQKFLVGT